MPRKTGPTDPNLLELIVKLKKRKDLQKVVKELSKPKRQKTAVNLFEIDRISGDSKSIIVTGKVLGVGSLSKPREVYAWSFSKSAKEKITSAGGKCHSLDNLLEKKTIEAKII